MSNPAQQHPAEFTGRFHDAALKYQQAQKHFAILVGLINELMGGHWWRPEQIEDCPFETVRIRILREPTADWSLVLGDYVHNLRSCLDYAICGVVQIANPNADLSRVQFPFGRLGEKLGANERRSIKGLGPDAIARIDAIRAEFGADLNFVNLLSNQDKHRLLVPVAVRQVPMRLKINQAENTASIHEDISGASEVWRAEIRDGDKIPMPQMLSLGVGVIIEGEETPFPLQDIERVNQAVQKVFLAIASMERSLLAR